VAEKPLLIAKTPRPPRFLIKVFASLRLNLIKLLISNNLNYIVIHKVNPVIPIKDRVINTLSTSLTTFNIKELKKKFANPAFKVKGVESQRKV
jgi:hypothetical protein